MSLGMIGTKLGMTQVFDDDGKLVPVTVIELKPNYVSQIKTEETDGYIALQLAYGDAKPPRENNRKRSRLRKPEMGRLKKAGLGPFRWFYEFRVDDVSEYKAGDAVTCLNLTDVFRVDVTGVSKGRGFAGAIKRHKFHRGPMSHGSKSHRRPGSAGSSATPSKVFKGKRMPGHYGAERVTVQNLKVIKLDEDKEIILVRGAVPGANGSRVVVRPSSKAGV
jgi:large subunit ribosomal protein L3